MRWCHNCRHFNTDWPFRCRYCGVGLEGRLCSSGHVNPPNASLVFCGECGKRLDPWGGRFSAIPYLWGLIVLVFTITVAVAWVEVSGFHPVVNALVVFAILVFGFRTAFQLVPLWLRSLIGGVLGAFFSVLKALLGFVFGIGIKGGSRR